MDDVYSVAHKPFNEYFFAKGDDKEDVRDLLLYGYRHNYLGWEQEEKTLGVPDVDGQMVAMALRIHLLPRDGITTLLVLSDDSPIIWSREDRETFFTYHKRK